LPRTPFTAPKTVADPLVWSTFFSVGQLFFLLGIQFGSQVEIIENASLVASQSSSSEEYLNRA